ncbi:MAG: 2-oxoacid:acceptor oxidoreductase subunit alpha [Anaerolineaceae bacterium]|jgi:2-oxoglutarate ferredoxin oxidoreductase subunit alpha
MTSTDISNGKPERRIVNDFCMTVCTVNGSGSATSNNVLFRALFHMGLPTSGKNVFPSNIKGMATWFVIRVSEAGFTGRAPYDNLVVAMNAGTFRQDLSYLTPGGVVFYADHLALPEDMREDLIVYPMPIKELMKQLDVPRTLKDFTENMLYVGVVGQMLGIPKESLRYGLDKHFAGKKAVADSNYHTVELSYDWAAQNLVKKDPYVVEKRPPLTDYIITDGNTAGAYGSMFGGMQFCSWYPITPATSMVEAAIAIGPKIRKDPKTGKNTFAILQVEDELAAAGAAVGAGWAGLRALTATSGPGISLMTETVGLAYFTETPVVIWNVQRVGPSTGLPTRTAQGDLAMTYYLSHGDTQHIIFIPGTVTECFEFGWKAFDIADKYQTPVFVLSDLDLGMNQWMTKKFEYPDKPIDRGKILWEEDLDRFQEWGRYMDIDGDGIPYRTVLGNKNPRAPYFSRGTGHNQFGNYSEDSKNWADLIERIGKKFIKVVKDLPEPVITRSDKEAKIGLINMGSTEQAVLEAQYLLGQAGLPVDVMRVRSIPSNTAVREFIASHERNYVLELNRDGQLCQILKLEVSGYSQKLISISEVGGLPMNAIWVRDQVLEQEKK